MIVHTKQIEDTWHCTVTFKGYDYGESGNYIKEAQDKMLSRLMSMGVEFNDIKWDKPQYDVRQKTNQ